jgi:hypothetical protein
VEALPRQQTLARGMWMVEGDDKMVGVESWVRTTRRMSSFDWLSLNRTLQFSRAGSNFVLLGLLALGCLLPQLCNGILRSIWKKKRNTCVCGGGGRCMVRKNAGLTLRRLTRVPVSLITSIMS